MKFKFTDYWWKLSAAFDGIEHRPVKDTLQNFSVLLTDWYQNACVVTGAVVSDIKTLWIITSYVVVLLNLNEISIISWYNIFLFIYIWIIFFSNFSLPGGSHLHRGKIVGKLVFYYLIILALYMIETGFWMNKRIIEVLSTIVVKSSG